MTGLEDIVFENRNKLYGSYELRKKYPKYALWGFFLSLFLIFSFIVTVFIVENSELIFEPKMPKSVNVETLQLLSLEEMVLPEPPAQETQTQENLSLPEIKDTIIEKPEHTKNQKGSPEEDSLASNEKGKSNSPENNTDMEGDQLININIEKMAEFIGGTPALKKYITDNLPSKLKNNPAPQKYYIQFTVSKTGDVKDVTVAGADTIIEQEIERIMSMMPKWAPALFKGRPLETRCSIRIII